MVPKFRAWFKDTGTQAAHMVEWHELREFKALGDLLQYSGENKSFHLMQSTGLKDKNGVEIFEGDIVRSNWYEYDNNAYKKKGEVIFVGAQFVIAYDSQFDLETGEIEYDAHSLSYAENPEVIGNIYENPELLEQANEN